MKTEFFDQEAPETAYPHYPHVKVQLTGQDGNGFTIIGRTRVALRRGDVPADEINRFQDEAMSGDYNNLLQTVMRWVAVS